MLLPLFVLADHPLLQLLLFVLSSNLIESYAYIYITIYNRYLEFTKLFLFYFGFFVELFSLRPISWSFKAGLFQNRYLPGCREKNCLTGEFHTGSGLTYNVFHERSVVSLMALVNAQVGPKLLKGYDIGPKLLLFFLTHPFDFYKNKLSYSSFYEVGGTRKKESYEWSHSFFFSRNREARVNLSRIRENKKNFLFDEYGFIVVFYVGGLLFNFFRRRK